MQFPINGSREEEHLKISFSKVCLSHTSLHNYGQSKKNGRNAHNYQSPEEQCFTVISNPLCNISNSNKCEKEALFLRVYKQLMCQGFLAFICRVWIVTVKFLPPKTPPKHNLPTVNLVSFSGSIISVSFNNKELLNEVRDAQSLDMHRESIVKGTCVRQANLHNKTSLVQISLSKPGDPTQLNPNPMQKCWGTLNDI